MNACPAEGLGLQWSAGRCHIRLLADSTLLLELDIPKPVFRTVLARLAALCNERVPESVSPYGGEGELASHDSLRSYGIAFVNTPTELRLELQPK